MLVGQVSALHVWPVKSMGGGTALRSALVDGRGVAGDRSWAVLDARPERSGRLLTARGTPRLLAWSASYASAVTEPDDPPAPVLTAPDGRCWAADDPDLPGALGADLGHPVRLVRDPAGMQDLERSVLVTTQASAVELPRRYGRPLELARWRTNLHLDTSDLPPFAETGWEGLTLRVGTADGSPDGAGATLRLLHPCERCAIPTRAPDGSSHDPALLRWLLHEHDGTFGINARVVGTGVVREADLVHLLDAPRLDPLARTPRRARLLAAGA